MATTPPLMLQRPPAPPPDVTAQTGAGPAGPSASTVAQGLMGAGAGPAPGGPVPGGAANPAGAFLALSETMARFIKQGAQMSDIFQPYADRMLAILEAGTADVVKSQPQAGQTPTPNSPPTGASGTEPQMASPAPKTGPGAPAFPG